MPLSEFDIINNIKRLCQPAHPNAILGMGDDAALVNVPTGYQLAVSTDTLVTQVHFPKETPPEALGFKAIAVNLSDLSAMGASPSWITLSLTLPEATAEWVHQFCTGMNQLLIPHQCQLIGGDMTRGPLTITVTALGLLPEHSGLTRCGAKVGDRIYVTGTLGDAGLALASLTNRLEIPGTYHEEIMARLNYPTPRVACGQQLLHIAQSAIDISDGLVSDLHHILQASKVGASIQVESLPLSPALQRLPKEFAHELALTAGDDYELCFTVSPEKEAALQEIAKQCDCELTLIGTVEQAPGLRLQTANGKTVTHNGSGGYQHFVA